MTEEEKLQCLSKESEALLWCVKCNGNVTLM